MKFVNDEMKTDEGVTLNTTTYNAIMKVCGRAKVWEVVSELFFEMKRNGVKLDVVSYISAINALANQKRWNLATELFRDMRKEGVKNAAFSYRIMTSVVTSRKDRSADALRFLDEVREDAALSNIIFEETSKRGNSESNNEKLKSDSHEFHVDSIAHIPLSSV